MHLNLVHARRDVPFQFCYSVPNSCSFLLRNNSVCFLQQKTTKLDEMNNPFHGRIELPLVRNWSETANPKAHEENQSNKET
jgi:hypothetical protein